MHTRIAGLFVQRSVVTGNRTVGIECVGMTGAAGPCHLIAVSRDEIGALGVILRSGLPCLFPLGDAAALGEAGQIIVAGGSRGGGGIEVVGMVGHNEEIHILLLHGILVSVLQLARAVGILRGMGVDLTEVQTHVRFTDEEEPIHFRLLAVGTGDGNRNGVAAIRHVSRGRVGDLIAGDGRNDGSSVNFHGDGRIRTAVGKIHDNLGALFAARRGVGQRGDGDDDRLVLDLHSLFCGIGHTILILCRALEGQRGLAREVGVGNGISIGVAIDSARREGLFRAAVDRIGHGHVGNLCQLVELGGELVVHADKSVLRLNGHLRIEHIAESERVFDLMELHGKELGAAVEGPAAEGIAEVFDSDGVAAVLCSLVIEDVAAGGFLNSPPAVVIVEGRHIEALGVVGLAVNDLVGRGTQVLTVVFKGIVVAILMNGKDQGTVADIQLAVGQGGFDAGHTGRDLIVGLFAEAGAAVSVVDHDLVAVCGLLAGHGLRADVAVVVSVSRSVDRIELHRVDVSVSFLIVIDAEGAGVNFEADGLTVAQIVRVRNSVAFSEGLDLPLRALARRVRELRGAGRSGGVVLAAAGEVVGAVTVLYQLVHTGAGSDLQGRILFIGNCGITGGLAVGRFGAHNDSCRGGVNDEGRFRFGNAADRRCGVFFRSSQRSQGQHCENHHRNQQRGDNPLELSFHNFSS